MSITRRGPIGWTYCFECKKIKAREQRYGLLHDIFENLKTAQNNSCALCLDPLNDRPYVDHDHNTGRVRGLLCNRCNIGLGFFKDDIEMLHKVIRYLT